MKSTLFLLLALFFNLGINAQELNVFTLTSKPSGADRNQSSGFVSLSDIDHLSEHPDSLALPAFTVDHEFEKYRYISLSSKYRTRFLSRTDISESDTVYIYSYSEDQITSIPVSDVKVVAWLNSYTRPKECPCPEDYYQIGFEIENELLKGYENHFINTLVFVGNKNPFNRNKVKPVQWHKIDSTEFPLHLISTKVNFNFGNNDKEYSLGTCYKFEHQTYQIFIQKLLKNDWQFGLRLLAIDSSTMEKVDERLYHTSEGTSFAPLDQQWVGQLFKNRPMVLFGFKWVSFGCPSITFLDPNEKEIFINCDNRH